MALGLHRSRSAHTKRKIFLLLAICSALSCVLITTGSVMTPPEARRKMDLISSAFKDGQPLPRQYTCDDKNMSPPLAWSGAPRTTESLVLIVDDPDSPTGVWTHWILFNLPADSSELVEDVAKSGSIPGKQGVNDFKNLGYGGPCPPAGKLHRYFFKVYALDIMLDLQPGASRKDLDAAMTKHILAQGQLMGTYQRK